MTNPAHATPAPGTNAEMPTPSAAPAPQVTDVQVETKAPAAPAAPLSESPVNAQSATSDANQAAAAEAPKAEAPAPIAVSTTGVEAFDQVGRMLAEKGVTNSNDILTAAASGELSLADKAAMVEALGPDVANLAMAQLEGEVTRQREAGTAQATAQQAYADKVMGGTEGSWKQLQDFARSPEAGFSEADQIAIQEMLDDGGVKGEWAIDQIANLYQKSQGFSKAPSLLSGDGPTTAGFEPLSKVQYAEEMRSAQKKFGDGSREVEALRNRRVESLRRGF